MTNHENDSDSDDSSEDTTQENDVEIYDLPEDTTQGNDLGIDDLPENTTQGNDVESYDLPEDASQGNDVESDDSSEEEDDASQEPVKIVLNIGGVRYETLASTLTARDLDTRLAEVALLHDQLNAEEYFFDRNPTVFKAVIEYYRSGELHMPPGICGVSVKKELEYWNLRETLVEPCCWERYCSGVDSQAIIAKENKVSELEATENQLMETLTGFARFRLTVWWLLYRPQTSKWAKAFSIVSMLFITAATVGCCLETITELQDTENAAEFQKRCNTSSAFTIANVEHLIPERSMGLRVLDYVCNAFFTVQLVGRALVAPERLAFLRSPVTVINILALIPFYMLVVIQGVLEHCEIHAISHVVETAYVFNIIRVFRVFEMLAHFEPFLILVRAIRDSLYELVILLIVIFICVFIFGALIFYAEGRGVESETVFVDVPIGFWWSFITISSVGYGDFVPVTITGYIVGGTCALVGVVLLTLTVPILSNSFSFFYEHSKTLKQKTVKKKKTRQTTQVRLRLRRGKGAAKTFPMDEGKDEAAIPLIQVDSAPASGTNIQTTSNEINAAKSTT